MDQSGSPSCPGPPVLGTTLQGGYVLTAPTGPVIAEVGGLPLLSAPKHFSELGLLSGTPAEAGDGNGGLDDIRGIAQ